MRSAVVFCAFFACGMAAAQDTGSTGGGLAISIEQPTLDQYPLEVRVRSYTSRG